MSRPGEGGVAPTFMVERYWRFGDGGLSTRFGVRIRMEICPDVLEPAGVDGVVEYGLATCRGLHGGMYFGEFGLLRVPCEPWCWACRINDNDSFSLRLRRLARHRITANAGMPTPIATTTPMST